MGKKRTYLHKKGDPQTTAAPGAGCSRLPSAGQMRVHPPDRVASLTHPISTNTREERGV